jgi:polyhydroxybutyrate depolymerase
MRRGTATLAVVIALISVPVVLSVSEGTAFYLRNRSNGSIMSGGARRMYLLHVPGSYDARKPTPLVISMHGAGMWPASQQETSRWNELADQHGFIVVYPSGITGDGPRVWRMEGTNGITPDARFIGELIDTLSGSYNIDRERVFANGLSNGGGMAFVLSCTMSDRIAAVGMVGAAHLLPFDWCTDRNPVPMISFHGTADSATPYAGGASWVAPKAFPDIQTWTARWARRNRCAPQPLDTTVAPDVVRREYIACADSAAVVLYTVVGGGHTWPGGGPLPEWFVGRTTLSIDASRLMWEFFREHPLRARAAAVAASAPR